MKWVQFNSEHVQENQNYAQLVELRMMWWGRVRITKHRAFSLHIVLHCPQGGFVAMNSLMILISSNHWNITNNEWERHLMEVKILVFKKDTKNSNTWWCFTAPISPTRAIRNRKMPTAMTTPTTRRLEISPKPMPQAAIPMSSRLTSWGDTEV